MNDKRVFLGDVWRSIYNKKYTIVDINELGGIAYSYNAKYWYRGYNTLIPTLETRELYKSEMTVFQLVMRKIT